MEKIAIIGAGISGLSLAYMLNDKAKITIFEKSRGMGGRMSTRRAEPYFFDHGAQYFTIRTKEFKDFTQKFIDNSILQKWDACYAKFDGVKMIYKKNWLDDEERYVATPSMNSFSKFLAKNLNILLNTKITCLKKHKEKWQIYDDNNNLYENFDWVVSSIPSVQALDILPSTFKYYSQIESIRMQPLYSIMLGFKDKLNIEFDAAHITNSDLSWIAVNSSKPDRGDIYTLILNSSYQYATENLDNEKAMKHLFWEAQKILNLDLAIAEYKSIHYWKYANNEINNQLPSLIDFNQNIALCGDWSEGGRVEGAFISAYKLANIFKKDIL